MPIRCKTAVSENERHWWLAACVHYNGLQTCIAGQGSDSRVADEAVPDHAGLSPQVAFSHILVLLTALRAGYV